MPSYQYYGQYRDEIIKSEPWPKDAILYQPYEAEQILLAENASCLAVKTYLKMCDLPFDVKCCANAEFMSPGGRLTRLPLLKAGKRVISEFEPIVTFIEEKELGICNTFSSDELDDMRCHVSLVENIFTMAELYFSFVDKEIYKTVTAVRNGSVYPWPLYHLQNFVKRRSALRLLSVYQYNNMTVKEVLKNFDKVCDTLHHKLSKTNTPYFYEMGPCQLDAIAFGHLYSILTTNLPGSPLADTVKKYDRLIGFCQSIDSMYFQKK